MSVCRRAIRYLDSRQTFRDFFEGIPMVRRLLIALVLLAVPASTFAAGLETPSSGKKYAFLVGVKRYDHSSFQNLYYTENDVVELAKVLKQNAYQVTLLGDSQGVDKQPTRTNFLAQL